MTLTNQSFFEAADIQSIRLSCQNKECQSVLVIPISGHRATPFRCPHCDGEWFQEGISDIEALKKLITHIKTLQLRTKETKVLIQFEWC